MVANIEIDFENGGHFELLLSKIAIRLMHVF